MAYLYGISLIEASDGVRALTTVATAIIGLVANGPQADVAAFPPNRPVLVTDAETAIGKAGAIGTLATVLRAIADQVRTPIVVVRVEDQATPPTLAANVISTTLGNGQKTGLQALTAALGSLAVNLGRRRRRRKLPHGWQPHHHRNLCRGTGRAARHGGLGPVHPCARLGVEGCGGRR